MRILLSNDDGSMRRGYRPLQKALREFAEVQWLHPIVTGQGLKFMTLESSLRTLPLKMATSPSRCTDRLCLSGVNALMRPRPDIVVSGINAGPNPGDDVIYSGTVAAAMKAVIWGSPRWPCR